ncbi:MAG TPA: hypothetical protein VN829_22350, partial [Dongiaceae bacterium]|nr:hypothetical protein [Dongiaceae bacterium]
MGDDNETANTLPLPTQLGNTAVVIGGQLAPLQFVTQGQINALVPYGVSMNTQQQILVQRGVTYSQPVSVDVAPAQPQIFRAGGVNPGIIVAVKSDGTQFLVSSSSPASAGDVLVIYCAGLGPVDQNIEAGSQTPAS